MRNTYNLKVKITHLLCSDIFLACISMVVILMATLYPFNFSKPEFFSLNELRSEFGNNSFIQDQVNNVLLFMPWGFAIASILRRRQANLILQVLIAIIASFILSSSVELLQIMLPSRRPTPADIVNNSMGGLMGLIAYYVWNSRHFYGALKSLSQNRWGNSKLPIFSFLCGYIFLASVMILPWQGAIDFSVWSTDLPLAIGNEPSGDRPWQGYLSQLMIADKALPSSQLGKLFINPAHIYNYENSLVARYQFTPDTAINPKNTTNSFPELTWEGSQHSQIESNPFKGLKIDQNTWLKTTAPVENLNQRLRDSSQFTISTIIATNNRNQTGPARIITISRDSLSRNLTIGQEKENLVIRIRTMLTGQNGADIQLEVPRIFGDRNLHHIVITYSQARFQVYVDGVDRIYTFNLFELLPLDQKLFYYAVTFIPIGFYLAFLVTLAQSQIIVRNFILILYLLLPSLILETVLIQQSGKNISPINLGLGILFTAGVPILLKIGMKRNQGAEIGNRG